jgi:thiol:disulfide interchange protein DsbA
MLTRAAVVLCLLLATTACTAKGPDAGPAQIAPVATPMAEASVAASAVASVVAPSASTAAASEAASAAPAKLPAGPAPVLGTDYFMIDTPDQETGKTISVVEVFGYSCPHCAHFQPYVDAWKKKLPADVKFSYLPAAFGGVWDAFARAYYTADAMGVLPKSHDGIYKAVHVEHRPITNIEDIAALYADYGVDKEVFASTMQSFAITAKVGNAHALALRWGVDGTPTIVVAGKYRVMITAAGEGAFLRNVDWFIAKERAARQAH